MVAALRATLDNLNEHNVEFNAEVLPKLAAFDKAIAAGGQPMLPVFRGQNSERPPTRAIEPRLFFELALFYTRQESLGERYVRYNDFTEQRVFTTGPDPSAFYDAASNRLKPEFAAYVDRLRDLQASNLTLTRQAIELRAKLAGQDQEH